MVHEDSVKYYAVSFTVVRVNTLSLLEKNLTTNFTVCFKYAPYFKME